MSAPAPAANVENAVNDYVSGESCEVAAARYRISQQRLGRILRERGLWRDPAAAMAISVAKQRETVLAKLSIPVEEMTAAYLSGESVAALARRYKVSRKAITGRLVAAGVPLRTMGEANQIIAQSRTPEQRAAGMLKAQAATRGAQHSETHRRKIAETREQVGAGVSRHELRLAQMLQDRGIQAVPQKAVGRYNVDLASGSVAVEVFGGGWHGYGRHRRRAPKRLRYILDEGWNLLVIWTSVHFPDVTGEAADYVVAFVEEASRNPALRGEYRVIWGDGKDVTSSYRDVDDLALVPTRDGRRRRRT